MYTPWILISRFTGSSVSSAAPGGEEAVSSIAQYEVLPAPASRPTAWPGHLEHVSGYRWDPQLRFRHFYGANRCAALRVPAKVVPDPGHPLCHCG